MVARNLSISSSYLICWHAHSIPLYPLYFCKVCSNAFFFILTLVICLVFLDLSGVLSILLVSFEETTFSYADFTYCMSIIYFINSPSNFHYFLLYAYFGFCFSSSLRQKVRLLIRDPSSLFNVDMYSYTLLFTTYAFVAFHDICILWFHFCISQGIL